METKKQLIERLIAELNHYRVHAEVRFGDNPSEIEDELAWAWHCVLEAGRDPRVRGAGREGGLPA